MAERIIRVDDIDESQIAWDSPPLVFGVGDAKFKLDVSEDNRNAFFQAVAPYIYAATCLSGRRELTEEVRQLMDPAKIPTYSTLTTREQGELPRSRTRHTAQELRDCRRWMASKGISYRRTGQIPSDIWKAWEDNDVSLLSPGRIPALAS